MASPALLLLAAIETFGPPAPATAPAIFRPSDRAVSTWRREASASLLLAPGQGEALRSDAPAPLVARCVKLNNYWCIKKAGWNGEIAADGEGHVAFASAVDGAAVAALLLKRYYVDFGRRSAVSIIARWAPAACGTPSGVSVATLAPKGLGATLRARWLAGHTRGFAGPLAGRKAPVRRSIVADRVPRLIAAPTIATGLGETSRLMRPVTLDALMAASPNAPPSRSMRDRPDARSSGGACDDARIATYAAKAATGIAAGPDGDLGLFTPGGQPTPNLATMMANMAKVEIGPLGATDALIATGIAQAFRPGRNPTKAP